MFNRERTKELMEASNVKFVANFIGKSPKTIRAFLNGAREPQKDTILAWAAALKVPSTELWIDEVQQSKRSA